jgi:hypothetical protein
MWASCQIDYRSDFLGNTFSGKGVVMHDGKTMLRLAITKLLALGAGAFVFAVVFVINLLGEDALRYQIYARDLTSAKNYPIVAGWREIFPYFLWGYPSAVALSTVYAFWNGFPSERKRLLLYLLLMGVIGPITLINYTHADQFVNVKIAKCCNLCQSFL